MLLSEKRPVSIIIEVGKLATPPHEHCITRAEHDPRGGPETLRPSLYRTQGRFRPVQAPDALRRLAADDEPFAQFFKRSSFLTQLYPPRTPHCRTHLTTVKGWQGR